MKPVAEGFNGNYPLDVGRRIRYFGADDGWDTEYVVLSDFSHIKETVAFLYRADHEEDEPEPDGTCFFTYVDEGNHQFHYLVTARHVYDGLVKSGQGYVRVDRPEGGTSNIRLDLEPSSWLFHKNEAVDLAVQSWDMERWRGRPNKQTFWPLRMHATAEHHVLFEGADVVFVGLMIDFPGKQRNLLTLRGGIIALMPDEPITVRTYGPSEYIVLDAQSYKGNSGAPVFTGDFKYGLIGILTYGFDEEAERYLVRGVPHHYYNLGVSLVTPISKLEEIVNQKKEKARRAAMYPEARGAPLSATGAPFTKADMDQALRKVSRPDGKEVIEKRDQASSET